jgi:hypothetical protein
LLYKNLGEKATVSPLRSDDLPISTWLGNHRTVIDFYTQPTELEIGLVLNRGVRGDLGYQQFWNKLGGRNGK